MSSAAAAIPQTPPSHRIPHSHKSSPHAHSDRLAKVSQTPSSLIMTGSGSGSGSRSENSITTTDIELNTIEYKKRKLSSVDSEEDLGELDSEYTVKRNRSISPSESISNSAITSSITTPDNSIYNELDVNIKHMDELEKNPDYNSIISTISLLKKQKLQCLNDINELSILKTQLLNNPKLLYDQSTLKNIPKPINIFMCPKIKWDKYKLKENSTDTTNTQQQPLQTNSISTATMFTRSHRKTKSLNIDKSMSNDDILMFKNYQLFNKN